MLSRPSNTPACVCRCERLGKPAEEVEHAHVPTHTPQTDCLEPGAVERHYSGKPGWFDKSASAAML